MKKVIVVGMIAVVALFFVNACPPKDAAKETMSFHNPKGWPEPLYRFDKTNKLTRAGFELGRTLFYDRRLSRNNTISCGSCHQQFAAFAHIDHPTSHGIENKLGSRNSPPLFNLNWQSSFFWDGAVNHIELQPINPIQNPLEMDEKLETVIGKLAADTMYKRLFKAAYGDEMVNSQRMLKAMAQFMGLMVSSNSKYDKYVRKEPGGEMTEPELNGLQLFRERCATCHKEPLFSDYSFRNNGLMPKFKTDSGRATITRKQEDMYKFKVPSLRNLKYTWPYMHDGRFAELSQVLDHYTGDKFDSPTLDQALRTRFFFTAKQKVDIIAFLNTLNDDSFVKDERFKDQSNQREIITDHSHNFKMP